MLQYNIFKLADYFQYKLNKNALWPWEEKHKISENKINALKEWLINLQQTSKTWMNFLNSMHVTSYNVYAHDELRDMTKIISQLDSNLTQQKMQSFIDGLYKYYSNFTSSLGRDIMTDAEFNKWVNYSNGKYVWNNENAKKAAFTAANYLNVAKNKLEESKKM